MSNIASKLKHSGINKFPILIYLSQGVYGTTTKAAVSIYDQETEKCQYIMTHGIRDVNWFELFKMLTILSHSQ